MKKTIYFSLFAFLIIFGSSKNDVSGSNPGNNPEPGTADKTVSWNFTGGYYAADLICDDMVIDLLWGNVNWHVRDHYKNGELEWSIYTPSGNITVASTGETFEIHESDKVFWSQGKATFHCNLIGDHDTHFILFGHYDLTTWAIIIDKANCP